MAKQNLNDPTDKAPQGDNRQAGDVDGNRGAKPKTGTQGVNKTAANHADGAKAGTTQKTPGTGAGARHSEADALYREE